MSNKRINSGNWTKAPNNRWSFQRVQTLFPTARIHRGAGPVAEFINHQRDISQIGYLGLAGQPRTIAQMLDETYTDAFLVLKDGVILTEIYANGMHPGSHHLLNSVTKSFLGALTGAIAADGDIDANQRVAHYVPEFHDTAFRNTTVQNALDMTAAVHFGEDYADPQADFWVETAVVGWQPSLVHAHSSQTLFDFARSLQKVEQAEGEKFHYRTVLTNVVGMVIEAATQVPVQDLLEQRLWQKLGPEQDAAIVVDRSGFPYVGAGMNACARDLARFGQMLLQNGFFNGSQILPQNWITDTQEGNDTLRNLFAATDYSAMMPGGHYHNQVWGNATEGSLSCIGIYGQTIYVNRTTGVVMVKLSTHPEPVDRLLFGDTFLAFTALSKAL